MSSRNKIFIPKNIQEELKCAMCSHCLSVPTVRVHLIKEGCYVCGRCAGKLQPQGVRASAYEAVAQLLLFPCRYANEGCKKQLSWGSVADHEASCEFRYYECPSVPLKGCAWVGSAKNIVTHFHETHKSLYLDVPYFKLPLEEIGEVNKILFVLNEVFLVQYIIEENKKMYISVKYIGKPPDSGKFCYDIKMKGETQESVYKIGNKTTKPAQKFDLDKRNMNEIDVNSLISIMNTRNITCYLNISEEAQSSKTETKKAEEKSGREESSKSSEPVIDKNILMELECPVCQEYMIPPIFICGMGHSICGNCKEKILHCPSCRSKYSDARNYVLEKLTALVRYPCKNESDGCKFTGNSTVIRAHENTCRRCYVKCPLEIPEKCSWKGSVIELNAHANQCHRENTWIKLNDSLFRNLTSVIYTDFHIISFDGELFKVSCKHSKSQTGPVQWSFQQIDLDAKDKPKYKFEIEFLDVNNSGRRFIINDLCYGLTEHKETFDQALTIPNNLLLPYINKDFCLIFKYNMSHV